MGRRAAFVVSRASEPAVSSDKGVREKGGDAGEFVGLAAGGLDLAILCQLMLRIPEDGVDDFPAAVFDGLSAGLGRWQQGFQDLPFGVVEVGRLGWSVHKWVVGCTKAGAAGWRTHS